MKNTTTSPMPWKFGAPSFEYEQLFQDALWPWAGHKLFAYDLVVNTTPRRIVELGTHKGTSLFSFAQAAKDHKIPVEIFAIDTWRGDKQAGFYGEEVFRLVNEIKDTFYKDVNICLLRETFDEAVEKFDDASIDILHIDGLHTYEAVRHDFETWEGKVAKDGIILFHDIKVAERDFGVYKFWNEIKDRYTTAEFAHSFGLGILFRNEAMGQAFLSAFSSIQNHYYFRYERMRTGQVKERDAVIATLRKDLSDMAVLRERDRDVLAQKERALVAQARQVKERDIIIAALRRRIAEMSSSKFWKLRNIYIHYKNGIRNGMKDPRILGVFLRKRVKKVARKCRAIFAFTEPMRLVIAQMTKMTPTVREEKKQRKMFEVFDRKISVRSMPALQETPMVSIIVLNRNGKHYLMTLLRSIAKHTRYKNYELIIIDNDSSDGSYRYIKKNQYKLPIRLIRNKHNTSFSSGCNQGANAAKGDLLVFMNNDIEVRPLWLCALVNKYLEDKENAGAIGAKLIYPKGKPGLSFRIQHAGIKFRYDGDFDFYRPYNLGNKSPVTMHSRDCTVPAVTAALLLVSKERFSAVGGFDERYFYGYEDVDLCLKLEKRGYRNIFCAESVALHYEFGSQEKDRRKSVRERRQKNIALFKKKWQSYLAQRIRLEKISHERFYIDRAPRITLVVTETGDHAVAGDFFTAKELGDALTELGFEVAYHPRRGSRAWENATIDTDIIISLLDAFDVAQIVLPPHAIKVAWIRNWFDRWIERHFIDVFDVLLASSESGALRIQAATGREVFVFPIATNWEKFHAEKSGADERSGVVFTGNYWHAKRGVTEIIRDNNFCEKYQCKIFGSHWKDAGVSQRFHRGFVPYKDLPSIYKKCKVVIDDAAFPTRPYGSVNSRVFDAIAAGCVVVTNGARGARETFRGKLPVFHSKATLKKILDTYLNDSVAFDEKVRELQEFVRDRHTYKTRARQLMHVLRLRFLPKKIAIKVPVPKWDEVESWGDYHFARALEKYFRGDGWDVKIQILPEWDDPATDRDCVAVLVLRGLSAYTLKPHHINIMWNISHPDKIGREEYNAYDYVFVASEPWAEHVKAQTHFPVVRALLQCTDHEVFRPIPPKERARYKTELLFVGNSRNEFRTAVKHSLSCGLRPAIYGKGWARFVDSALIRGENIPNDKLHKYYCAADIVLNDHWEDMAKKGFVSNRIYDVLASGGVLLTDRVEGMDARIADAVTVYDGERDFCEKIAIIKRYGSAHRKRAEKIREYIVARYSFVARARTIRKTITSHLTADHDDRS